MRPVFDLIERFGDEIEYDLFAHLSLDLLDFFRGDHTWDRLFRMLAHLPWWSRYQLAQADADDIAANRLAQQPDDDRVGNRRPASPPLSTWDPIKELRADIMDGFNALLTQQSGDRRRKGPKPSPRPESAYDRAVKAREYATVTELFDTFTPGR